MTETSIVIPDELKSLKPTKMTHPPSLNAVAQVPHRSPLLSVPAPVTHLPAQSSAKKPADQMQELRARCRQLGLAAFFQEQASVRSLGFTSAIAGEGKTFLARLTAEVLAEDNDVAVTLLECNWENPTLASFYNLASGLGLADWLLGRCSLESIRQQVTSHLSVITVGESVFSVTKLLRELQQRGVDSLLAHPDEVLILDLPAVATTAYGPLAARLADVLLLVVRVGVTPEALVKEAREYLRDLPVQGVILNRVVSRIPRWLRRLL